LNLDRIAQTAWKNSLLDRKSIIVQVPETETVEPESTERDFEDRLAVGQTIASLPKNLAVPS
jgi:hypothetical protein